MGPENIFEFANFIGFFNGLLGGSDYLPNHGAGSSGVLFPPRCHVPDNVAPSGRCGPLPAAPPFFSLVKVLDFGGEPGQHFPMVEPVSLNAVRDDTLWAVVANMGRTTRVAEIFPSRVAAQADKDWREQQVRAYAGFLKTARQPMPNYTIRPIKRAELPRSWRPLPALGFLHGKFI